MTKNYLADDHISGEGYQKWFSLADTMILSGVYTPPQEGPQKFRPIDTKDLTLVHFAHVLSEVLDQVAEGKGKERHGKDLKFENQPWQFIAKFVGSNFLDGQAVKKILELRNLTGMEAYKREILGAIAYLVMALMYKEHQHEQENLHKM